MIASGCLPVIAEPIGFRDCRSKMVRGVRDSVAGKAASNVVGDGHTVHAVYFRIGDFTERCRQCPASITTMRLLLVTNTCRAGTSIPK